MLTNRHTTILAIVSTLALLWTVQWASAESAGKSQDYKELRHLPKRDEPRSKELRQGRPRQRID